MQNNMEDAEDIESELSRFRQQWKDEVSARQSQSHGSSSTTSPPPKAKAPAFLPTSKSQLTKNRIRLHSTASEGAEDKGENVGAGVEFHRDTSLTALRRLSFAGEIASAVPKSALEYYEKAVEKETEGNLGESLSLYRKAFRMDAKVDTTYKDKYFPRPPQASSTAGVSSLISKDKQPHSAHPPSTTLNTVVTSVKEESSLSASFAGVKIQVKVSPRTDAARDVAAKKDTETQNEEKVENLAEDYFPIANLPPEILLQILRILALSDIASFVRIAQVCKALAYVVATEQHIWRAVCESHYSQMIWDWKVTVHGHAIVDASLSDDQEQSEEEGGKDRRKVPVNEEELLKYSQLDSWKKMFQLRPRIRFNGIYISICNYLRAGANSPTSVSWNTPVHIVTYYRYLRFYPDGTVLSLLSTCEPAEVVYGFNKHSLTPVHFGGLPIGSMSWGKQVVRGRWRMDADGLVDVETDAPRMERYLFRMALRIRGVRAGGKAGSVNKLIWEGFWSWNKLTGDLAEISLKNDKAFFFSRVGSIERELRILQW